jgi:hypothetical protein
MRRILLAQYFVIGVEDLSNANRIELIGLVPRESLFFERFSAVNFGRVESHELPPPNSWYFPEMESASQSEHFGRTDGNGRVLLSLS